MTRTTILAALIGLLTLALSACGQDVEIGPQKMTLQAAEPSVANDGSWVQIAVKATDGQGNPGTGEVVMNATRGSFRGFKASGTVTLENGQGSIEWRCDRTLDELCIGDQVVNALWRGLAAYASVEVVDAGSN
ncbi:MAG: hypothetical protein HY901_03050 [Deltaproteobacteria bacterium]|nr:hypothetical protein [Deltaproteobacteria bacterium]